MWTSSAVITSSRALTPFPTFAEVAWVFRDLGREEAFSAVLDATPIESPWMDAAQAIIDGQLVRAAESPRTSLEP